MTTPHPYRLPAYHNPEKIDESKVPEGWRFLYANEAGQAQLNPCRCWIGFSGISFSLSDTYMGSMLDMTYIVPVAP
jgi:hypothetical protein